MKKIISLSIFFGFKARKPIDAELVLSVTTDDLLTMIDVDCKFIAEFDAARYSAIRKVKDTLQKVVEYDGKPVDLTILESERKALAAMINNYCIQIAMDSPRYANFHKQILTRNYENATNTYLKLI